MILSEFDMCRRVTEWEQKILKGTEAFRRPPINALMHFASFMADSQTWILMAIMAFFLPVVHTVALPLAVALLAGTGLSQVAKRTFRRPRPRTRSEALQPLAEDPDHFSFPSGHTTAAFAAAVVLSQINGFAPLMTIYATLVGISRVYLGAHYPLDVVAGASLGSACGFVAITVLGLI